MSASGLKLQIAVTLVGLLTLAILLGNIVVFAFLQRGVVRSEIEHARSLWRIAHSTADLYPKTGQSKSGEEMKALCDIIGGRCKGVVFSGGEQWLLKDMPEIRKQCLKLAKESAKSNAEIIKLERKLWGILSFKKRHILIAEPLPQGDSEKPKSAVVVIALDSIHESMLENRRAIFVYLLVNVILLTVVGFFRLIKISVKPIERMVTISESYHESDRLLFSGEQKRSEFGQLSMALNRMVSRIESDRIKLRKTVTSLETVNSELLKTQKEMIRTEKIASVGRLSAGLAHEIGNPIGIVQGYVELLQQPDLEQTQKEQFVERALSELGRVNKLVRQLLDYAGSSSQEMSIVNLRELFEGVCQIIALKKYNRPISLLKDIPKDIFIECDGESLRQVFLNCLLNALDAIESRVGEFERKINITVEKNVEAKDNQANVHIRIKDNGIGIDEKDLEVIFDPFFTTKDLGKGTGLGLFVSHSIIDAHGGRIWINSTLGKGSTVYIDLPICMAADKEERDETSDH